MAQTSVRMWLVALAVLGLVASLLGAAPQGSLGPQSALGAHGDDPDVDFEAMYEACVGPATESAGFEDTVGLNTEEQINCLGHYGITQGRSPTMFAPRESVLRWQMALFMARAAAPAGIVLENPAEDQGFTDIGAVSEEARNAINGLAKLGIMPGTSQTQFSPNSAVTRGSMALILDGFLRNATRGAGGFDNADSYDDVKADNFNVFTDVNSVSLLTYNAIYRIYEAGVTQGTGNHLYGPNDLVTRQQMAAFIMRTLAHTVARPAGVSVQAAKSSVLGMETVELLVSVRDTAHQPMVDAQVDVFQSTDPDEAFKDDGACDTANVGKVGSVGRTACQVDTGDEQTDSNGDITEMAVTVEDADVTLWAWTGDVGDDFDNDDTTAAQLTIGFAKAANQTLVTDNLADGQTRLKFGETATVTLQIADEDGVAVADKGKTVTIGHMTTAADGSETSGSSTYTTDDDGKIVLEYTQTDSNTGATGQTATVKVNMSNAPADLPLKDKDGAEFMSKTYTWSDAVPVPTTLMISITSDVKFETASDEGDGASGTVRATLTDQFGDPIRGRRITFTSDTDCTPEGEETECTPPGLGSTGRTATTRRNGQATLNYRYDSDESAIETIKASLTRDEGEFGMRGECVDGTVGDPFAEFPTETCTETDDIPQVLEADKSVEFYWVGDVIDAPFTGRILVKDTDNDQLVVEADGRVMLVKYDANDQFNDLDGGATVMAEFEKPLMENADPEAGNLRVDRYESEAAKVSKFALLPPTIEITSPDAQSSLKSSERTENDDRPMAADNGVLVVGAPFETPEDLCDHDNDGGTTPEEACKWAGAVYIYPNGATTAAGDVVRLAPPYLLGSGHFGWDVDISGDTIVVGSGRRAGNAYGNNQVYVYVRSGGGVWPATPTATFTSHPSKTPPSASTVSTTGTPQAIGFGEGVAISSDGSTIAVVAPGPSWTTGGVRVYARPGGGWADDNDSTDNPLLRGGGGDGSGWNNERSVAINGDGSVIVAGGCNIEGSSQLCKGWLFVYERPSGGWADAADSTGRIWANGGFKSRQEYAKHVAVSEDGNTVVVSGHYHISAGQRGVAYVYVRDSGGWTAKHVDTIGSPANQDEPIGFELTVPEAAGVATDILGHFVAISSDGSTIALSHQRRPGVDWKGAVVVYKRPAGGWADSSSPAETHIGAYVRAYFGVEVTFDKTNNDLYAAASEARVGGDPLPIWHIIR